MTNSIEEPRSNKKPKIEKETKETVKPAVKTAIKPPTSTKPAAKSATKSVTKSTKQSPEQPMDTSNDQPIAPQSPLIACQHCACESSDIDAENSWIRALLCNQTINQSATPSKFLVNLAPTELIDLISQWKQHYESINQSDKDTNAQSIQQTNLRLFHYLYELSHSTHIRPEIAKEVETQLDQLHQTISRSNNQSSNGFLTALIEQCQQLCRVYTVNGHARIKPRVKIIHQSITQIMNQPANQMSQPSNTERLSYLSAFYVACSKFERFNQSIKQVISQPIKDQQAQLRTFCINMMIQNPESVNHSTIHSNNLSYATAVWAIGSDRLIDLLAEDDDLSFQFLTHVFTISQSVDQSTNQSANQFTRASTYLLSQSRFFDLSIVNKLNSILCTQISQSIKQSTKWSSSFDDLINQTVKQPVDASKVEKTLSKIKITNESSISSLSVCSQLSQLIERLPVMTTNEVFWYMLLTVSVAAQVLSEKNSEQTSVVQLVSSVVSTCLRVLVRMQPNQWFNKSINQSISVLLCKLSSVMDQSTIESSFDLSNLAVRLVRSINDQAVIQSVKQLAQKNLKETSSNEPNSSLLWTSVIQSTKQESDDQVDQSSQVTDQTIIDVCQQLAAPSSQSTVPVSVIAKVFEVNSIQSTDRLVNQSIVRFAFFFLAHSAHLNNSLIERLQSISLSIMQRAASAATKKRKRDDQTATQPKIDIMSVLLHLRAVFECAPSSSNHAIISRLVLRSMIQSSNQSVNQLINAAIYSSLPPPTVQSTKQATLSEMSFSAIDASATLQSTIPIDISINKYALATISSLINLAVDYSIINQSNKQTVHQPKVFSHSQIDFASHCTHLFSDSEIDQTINVRIQQSALTFLAIACRQEKTFFLGDVDATRILQSMNDARNQSINQSLINDLIVCLLDHRSSLAWSRAPLLISVCQRQLKLIAKTTISQSTQKSHDVHMMSLSRALAAFARDAHSTPISKYAPSLIADVLMTVHETTDQIISQSLKQHIMPSVFSLMAVCTDQMLDCLIVQTHASRQDMLKKWRREYASEWKYRG